jgi:hypothetical protein
MEIVGNGRSMIVTSDRTTQQTGSDECVEYPAAAPSQRFMHRNAFRSR